MAKNKIWKFVLTKFNHIVKKRNIKELKGKTVVVDASFVIMSRCISYRSTGVDFTNKRGDVTSHIKAILDNVYFHLSRGIVPVYIFDGQSHLLKQDTIAKRRKRKEIAKEKCKLAKTRTEFIKYFKRTFSLTSEMTRDIIKTLDYLGVPYIEAVGEADPQLAAMSLRRDIYGVISDDIDIVLFGGNRLVRRDKEIINTIDLQDLLDAFAKYFGKSNFTRENLIDIIVLFGSDYADGIGHREDLLEVYKKTGYNLNNSFNYLKKRDAKIPEKLVKYWKEIKTYFLEPEVIKPDTINIKMKKPLVKELKRFLLDHDFSMKSINRLLDVL